MSAAEDVQQAFEGKRGKILLVGGALAVVGYVAYTRWNPPASDAIDPTSDAVGVETDATRVPQSQPPVGNDTQTGTATTRPTTNPSWQSQGVDLLVGRGASAAAAESALSKALTGEALTAQERAWVSQVIAVLGSAPDGMPPMTSEVPTTPGGGTATTLPPAPTNLRVQKLTRTSVTVTWNASPGAKGYRINFKGGIVDTKGTAMTSNALKPNGNYGVVVKAYNDKGLSTGAASTVFHTPK